MTIILNKRDGLGMGAIHPEPAPLPSLDMHLSNFKFKLFEYVVKFTLLNMNEIKAQMNKIEF